MSSAPGGQGQPGAPQQPNPPFAPHNASLGGLPATIPDIPITAVFLVFYIAFAATHMIIMKKNEARGHKFIFNGALFGFCAVRVVTMSLRIAWSQHSTNISLGIAAQVFVYVGTIILYIVNWFFTQRIIRAQHPHFGWSMPYRGIHRLALVCLVLSLVILVIGAIQQFFTLDANTLRIDRALQLTGQTYFAAFCFAPIPAVLLSLAFPRRGTEKFGAGRLRNNIAILLAAVVVLSIGQIFRTVIAWLPATPLRSAQGQPLATPWYFTKACFYTLNFTTELLVVIWYAIARVDLRFHIPDGSKQAGDYSKKRNSDYKVNVTGNEKDLKRRSGATGSIRSTRSNETVHEFEDSLFDDSKTLADSLRYPSTILEIDPKSGNWKVKRASTVASLASIHHSNNSESSLWTQTRNTWVDKDAPPVPAMSEEWPLRQSQLPRDSAVPDHRNRSGHSPSGSERSKMNIVMTPDIEKGDAIDAAIRNLEGNGAAEDRTPSNQVGGALAKAYGTSSTSNTSSTENANHTLNKQDSNNSIIATAEPSTPVRLVYVPPEETQSVPSSLYSGGGESRGNTSFDIAEAEREFDRFSFEASPRGGRHLIQER